MDNVKEFDFSDGPASCTCKAACTPSSSLQDHQHSLQHFYCTSTPQAATPSAPLAALRGGSKKRKDPDLNTIMDEEERKRAERKIRNKEAAQNSRDRVKSHIVQLECSLQTMSYTNAALQQQLQLQIGENRCLRERLRQAELLLQKSNIDTGLLTRTEALMGTQNNCMATSTSPGNHAVPLFEDNLTKLRHEKGPLASGFMTFALLFTFVFAFNFPSLPSQLQFMEPGGDSHRASALRPRVSVGRLLDSEL
eukprot:GGOE01021507.1.p1 GENE.GGOE01021507.1~~GGOE01021507.1.p1  ORF type:complete len:286 (-),score=48.73 GGOE01021507.1:578-1330(-)